MELRDKKIIIVSNEPWGDVWYSKHNYAHELSKRNEVVFIDPVRPWRPTNLFGAAPWTQRVSDSLTVLRYRNPLPIANKLLYRMNERMIGRAIRTFLAARGFRPDLFITFDPIRLTTPCRLDPRMSIFFCVDRYDFSFHGERALCEQVDAIITVSDIYTRRYTDFDKPKLTIGHAIAEEEFNAAPSPLDLPGYGLFVGTIDSRLDHALVRKMMERFPTTPFVFIGRMALPEDDPDRPTYIGTYPNLHYLGVKHFKELKPYIAGSHFCITPLDRRILGNRISHHKTLQYLALGKPVFSCVFDDYEGVADIMYMENDHERSLANLGAFLKEGEPVELAAKRIAFAREHTFTSTFARIETFLGQVEAMLPPDRATTSGC